MVNLPPRSFHLLLSESLGHKSDRYVGGIEHTVQKIFTHMHILLVVDSKQKQKPDPSSWCLSLPVTQHKSQKPRICEKGASSSRAHAAFEDSGLLSKSTLAVDAQCSAWTLVSATKVCGQRERIIQKRSRKRKVTGYLYPLCRKW